MSEIKPYPGSFQDIERVADALRHALLDGKEMHNVAVLESLVERTGGEITVVHDPSVQEADGGSLEIRGIRNYTIFLSPYTSRHRDNFTIAHEVGHYVLHFLPRKDELTVPLWFTRYGTGLTEWQANRFAAALLMPKEAFAKRFAEEKQNLSLLSGIFRVSQDAVEVRAKSLGLLTQ